MSEAARPAPTNTDGAPASAGVAPARGRRGRRALLALALLALALLGLEGALLASTAASYEPLAAGYAGPAPLPPEVAARFDYPERERPPEVVHEAARADGFRFVQVRVTTPGDAAPHLAQLLDLQPDAAAFPGPRPAVVISPILGGDGALERLVARGLVARGLRATIVLRAESAFDGAAPEARLERVLRTAVIDRRRAIDWLERDPRVDRARIGALGTSLGGLVTTALAAVEPRVRRAAILLAGGDLGEVVLASSEDRIERYVDERVAAGTPRDRLADAIRAAVPSDPLRLAPFVDARRLVTVQARFDTVVPLDAQARLHEALGRPARWVVPAGHYTTALALPFLLPRLATYLGE